MKKINILLISILFLSVYTGTFAQKITVIHNALFLLSGQSKINLEYNYDSLIVGKFSESDYIKEKVEGYNKQEPGKGDKWLVDWKNYRTSQYQPAFEKMLNLYLKKTKVYISPNHTDAKYTMIVKTDFIETGFNAGIIRKPAYINTTVTIVETMNRNVEVTKIKIIESSSKYAAGELYDTPFRIKEAYTECGKVLAKFLKKNGLNKKTENNEK